MALSADSLLERMQLKSQVSRWRLAAIAILALAIIIFVAPSNNQNTSLTLGGDAIARIEVTDIITQDRDRDAKIKEIAENDNLQAVILHVDSPGGTIVGGETLYYSIKSLADQKPVVVVMGSVAASGGYMAALPAHHIIAHEGTLTGSIGVVLQTAEFTDLAEKMGVNLLTFKSGELKAAPSPFEKLTPKARNAVDASIESGYQMFVRMVAESRKMDKSQVLKLADGRVFTGSQALQQGLIDAIGSESDAILWLQEAFGVDKSLPVKDISLKPQPSKFDAFLTRMFGDGKLGAMFNSGQGLMAIWKPVF